MIYVDMENTFIVDAENKLFEAKKAIANGQIKYTYKIIYNLKST